MQGHLLSCPAFDLQLAGHFLLNGSFLQSGLGHLGSSGSISHFGGQFGCLGNLLHGHLVSVPVNLSQSGGQSGCINTKNVYNKSQIGKFKEF